MEANTNQRALNAERDRKSKSHTLSLGDATHAVGSLRANMLFGGDIDLDDDTDPLVENAGLCETSKILVLQALAQLEVAQRTLELAQLEQSKALAAQR